MHSIVADYFSMLQCSAMQASLKSKKEYNCIAIKDIAKHSPEKQSHGEDQNIAEFQFNFFVGYS